MGNHQRACFAAHWQAVESGRHRAEVDIDLALAREYGVQSIPSFVFGNRYLVSGAQTVDGLTQVVDKGVVGAAPTPSTPTW